MPVYILHFSEGYYRAHHYLGATDNLERRLHEHLTGGTKGSPLVHAALDKGIKVTLARVYTDEGFQKEKMLKRQKNIKRYCPICQGKEPILEG